MTQKRLIHFLDQFALSAKLVDEYSSREGQPKQIGQDVCEVCSSMRRAKEDNPFDVISNIAEMNVIVGCNDRLSFQQK